jgi:hypothetical protein
MNGTMVVVVALAVVAYALPCAVIAGTIRQNRGGEYSDGFLLGLFLGVIGVIIVSVT